MSVAEAGQGEVLRVLIVEDEALVAMELEYMLEDAGYEPVGTADDMASALAAVSDEAPDLAMVDVQLARGESGIDVAKALQERGVPVFFATGNCPGDEGRQLAIGCMHKPIVDSTLRAALSAARRILDGGEPPAVPPSVHFYGE